MKIYIDKKYHDQRLDKFVEIQLKKMGFEQTTRSMIKDYISKGVSLNGEKTKPSYRLKQEDIIDIDEKYWEQFFKDQDLSSQIIPQDKDLEILYEDEYLIVLVKPKGMIVHPGVGNKKDTLANYLRGYLESKNEFDTNMDRAGIVHRLDKGVSGIMVVAKNKHVQNELKKQFAQREVHKYYLADVESFKTTELTSVPKEQLDEVLEHISENDIDFKKWFEAKGYIGRDRVNRYRMAFKSYEFGGSKEAQSYILPLEKDRMIIKIVTGRMHQIRATLYYYGYYIKGDTLYKPGKGDSSSENIMLKSIYLSFVHPIKNKKIFFIRK